MHVVGACACPFLSLFFYQNGGKYIFNFIHKKKTHIFWQRRCFYDLQGCLHCQNALYVYKKVLKKIEISTISLRLDLQNTYCYLRHVCIRAVPSCYYNAHLQLKNILLCIYFLHSVFLERTLCVRAVTNRHVYVWFLCPITYYSYSDE